MLENLYIKNVALIKEQTIDLTEGLNIISGESGSGKSMLIDTINFILGNKTKKDFIRHNETEAYVCATFFINNDETVEKISDFGIEVLEDKQIQIKRTINEKGKSVIKINERNVTLGVLKEVGTLLIDVHLQKDNYSILKKSSHIDYLDFVCKEELSKHKDDLKENVTKYKALKEQIDELLKNEQEKQRKLDILNFELEELEKASLEVGEDEILSEKQKMLSNAEKIADNSETIVSLLYNGDEEMSAYDKITQAISLLEEIEDVSETLKNLKASLEECQINVEETALTIRNYSNDIGGSGEELREIDDRLALIFKLKKKYGKDIEEILAYQEKIAEEIYTLSNSEKIITKLQKEQKEVEETCLKICSQITKIRTKHAKPICKSIEDSLKELGMEDSKFNIIITKNDSFTEKGIDDVSFHISTNKGQDLKPLENIVSGGEMSRIMIAIKSLISSSYSVETFIFDEIDTGVSGRTAQKVGEKLRDMSKNHQVLCITHLPQIASQGENNILIYKEAQGNETFTNIVRLDSDGKVSEIARLIGGKCIDDETINYAKQMVKMVDTI